MNILFVLAHPEPASFNAQLVEMGKAHFEKAGHTVAVSDLYAQGFDPVEKPAHYHDRNDTGTFSPLGEQRHAYKTDNLPEDVKAEIDKLEAADMVIFQFPVWWHSVPAILKGWFDRVFVSGGLYTSRMRYDKGYFRGKRAMCSITSGAPGDAFVANGRGGEVEQILWSTQFSLYYMGFDVLPPHTSFGVSGHGYSYVSEDEFKNQFALLEREWLSRLETVFENEPLKYPGWDDWNELGAPKNQTKKMKEDTPC